MSKCGEYTCTVSESGECLGDVSDRDTHTQTHTVGVKLRVRVSGGVRARGGTGGREKYSRT